MTEEKHPSNEQKRAMGENLARALLSSQFREVFEQRTDEGIDVICSRLDGHREQPPTRFQVKFGQSYRSGIRIAAATLRFLVSRVEDEPVFFVHYVGPQLDVIPDYFLVFHRWLLAHVEEVGGALERDEDLMIRHSELHPLPRGTADLLWAACRDEIGRVTGTSHSIWVKRRPHFSGYHFYRYCQEVAQSWDLALLCRNPDVVRSAPFPELLVQQLQRFWEESEREPTVASMLRIREYHPIARTPASVIRRAQGRLVRALADYDDGCEFSLADKFDVVQVSAARVVSSKYPRAVIPVLDVLRGWRKRSIVEVLVALQMASTLSLFDSSYKDALLKSIRQIIHDVHDSRIATLDHYQLLHHAHSVLGEIGQELRETQRAVELAEANVALELRHLSAYGWGVGPHVLTYYERALRADTARSSVAHDYNSLMYEVMARVIGATG